MDSKNNLLSFEFHERQLEGNRLKVCSVTFKVGTLQSANEKVNTVQNHITDNLAKTERVEFFKPSVRRRTVNLGYECGIIGKKTKISFKRRERQIDRTEVNAETWKKKTEVCGKWLYVSCGKVT